MARLYLDVDGAFSPICMGNDQADDLAWMRGPVVAIGAVSSVLTASGSSSSPSCAAIPSRFVWIDDREVTPSTWRWVAGCGVPNLLVQPNRFHGVTPRPGPR